MMLVMTIDHIIMARCSMAVDWADNINTGRTVSNQIAICVSGRAKNTLEMDDKVPV